MILFIIHLFFYPLACVDEGFYPRRYLVAAQTVGWVVSVLPWEDGTLQVRHDSQVAAIGAGNTCYRVVGTVRIAGILIVGVLGHDIVVVFVVRQGELAFAVSHPDAQLAATQRTEHYAAVGRDSHTQEAAFELMRVVVEHASAFLVGGVDEVQFHHQLATVTYTQ